MSEFEEHFSQEWEFLKHVDTTDAQPEKIDSDSEEEELQVEETTDENIDEIATAITIALGGQSEPKVKTKSNKNPGKKLKKPKVPPIPLQLPARIKLKIGNCERVGFLVYVDSTAGSDRWEFEGQYHDALVITTFDGPEGVLWFGSLTAAERVLRGKRSGNGWKSFKVTELNGHTEFNYCLDVFRQHKNGGRLKSGPGFMNCREYIQKRDIFIQYIRACNRDNCTPAELRKYYPTLPDLCRSAARKSKRALIWSLPTPTTVTVTTPILEEEVRQQGNLSLSQMWMGQPGYIDESEDL